MERDAMKRLVLISISALLLGGCAHFQGGTGNHSETDEGYGGYGPDFNREPANDLNDLGDQSPKNMKPGGQPLVPGHSVDIWNEPQ